MKLKESGSLTDTDILNISMSSNSGEIVRDQEILHFTSPFKTEDTKVTILPSSPKMNDSKNHDKVYYDDRFDNSVFDPFLALNSLPKILVSIGGMLFTGFFLNFIIVKSRILILLIFIIFRRGMCLQMFPSCSY